MHELGVVFHIADTLARIAEENQVTRIRRVTLELGEVSTVVPEYLIDVWNWNCKRTPLLTGCELVIAHPRRDTLRCLRPGLPHRTAGQDLPPLRQPPDLAPPGQRIHHQRDRGSGYINTPPPVSLGKPAGVFMRDSDYHGALVAQTSS